MGVTNSVELVDHFKAMKDWSWQRVQAILRSYRTDEYDFGLDATAVMNLTNVPITDAKGIVDSISHNDSGIINSLTLLTIIICLSESKQRLEADRLSAIFELVDFDETSKISKDEMTVLKMVISSAFASILDRNDERPSDSRVHQLTIAMFKALGKKENGKVSKKEFITFCTDSFKDFGGSIDGLFDYFLTKEEVEEEEPTSVIPKFDVEDSIEEKKAEGGGSNKVENEKTNDDDVVVVEDSKGE